MLLSSGEFRDKLSLHLSDASNSIVILSGFTKLKALDWLVRRSGTRDITVVARWLPGDLISGASDLGCYNYCRERDIRFGVSLGLHGKVYLTDGQILIGSANMTLRGLALAASYNDEFGYGFEAGEADISKLEKYLESVTWLDDQLFASMEAELETFAGPDPTKNSDWSADIMSKLQGTVEFLWVHELPFTEPEYLIANQSIEHDSISHDLDLFGLKAGHSSLENAIGSFQTTKAFAWLGEEVKKQGSISFGGLSKALHDALLDDPSPYRTQVKHLVAILFTWAERCPDSFEISRPRHSQVISLVK